MIHVPNSTDQARIGKSQVDVRSFRFAWYMPCVAVVVGVQKTVHINVDSTFLQYMQKVTGGFVRVSCIIYIINLKVHRGVEITNYYFALDTIVSHVVKSFPEVADLVRLVIRVVDKSNLNFLIGGLLELDSKTVLGDSLRLVQLEWA